MLEEGESEEDKPIGPAIGPQTADIDQAPIALSKEENENNFRESV